MAWVRTQAKVLESLGYQIDLSVCPPYDFRSDGGPDFSNSDARPCWFGEDDSLLEIPLSGAFVGSAGKYSRGLHSVAGHFDLLRLRGVLSRLNIVDRLMLSPEGHTAKEHRKLVEFLLRQGVRTFTWSFHSPSLMPGMTIYTQNDRDLQKFLDSFRRFFDYFLGELNGVATTPLEVEEMVGTGKVTVLGEVLDNRWANQLGNPHRQYTPRRYGRSILRIRSV